MVAASHQDSIGGALALASVQPRRADGLLAAAVTVTLRHTQRASRSMSPADYKNALRVARAEYKTRRPDSRRFVLAPRLALRSSCISQPGAPLVHPWRSLRTRTRVSHPPRLPHSGPSSPSLSLACGSHRVFVPLPQCKVKSSSPFLPSCLSLTPRRILVALSPRAIAGLCSSIALLSALLFGSTPAPRSWPATSAHALSIHARSVCSSLLPAACALLSPVLRASAPAALLLRSFASLGEFAWPDTGRGLEQGMTRRIKHATSSRGQLSGCVARPGRVTGPEGERHRSMPCSGSPLALNQH
jgi:hypothetical protein